MRAITVLLFLFTALSCQQEETREAIRDSVLGENRENVKTESAEDFKNRLKRDALKAQLKSWKNAIQFYQADTGYVPKADSIHELEAEMADVGFSGMNIYDPWDRELIYTWSGSDSYKLYSVSGIGLKNGRIVEDMTSP
jgi:hypothetical protein